MKLVKNEYENQMKTYQNLYQSCVAYGVRKWIKADKEKEDINKEIEDIELECANYEKDIKKLEEEIEEVKKKDQLEREEAWDDHKRTVQVEVKEIKEKKEDIKKAFLDYNKAVIANANLNK